MLTVITTFTIMFLEFLWWPSPYLKKDRKLVDSVYGVVRKANYVAITREVRA